MLVSGSVTLLSWRFHSQPTSFLACDFSWLTWNDIKCKDIFRVDLRSWGSPQKKYPFPVAIPTWVDDFPNPLPVWSLVGYVSESSLGPRGPRTYWRDKKNQGGTCFLVPYRVHPIGNPPALRQLWRESRLKSPVGKGCERGVFQFGVLKQP